MSLSDSKKRKADASSSTSAAFVDWLSFSADPHRLMTAGGLQQVLDATSPHLLKEQLIKALADASPNQLQTIVKFLGPLCDAAPTISHCVRCHALYDTTRNDATSCTIAHSDHADYDIQKARWPDYDITISCCGYKRHGDYENRPPKAFCFVGRHSDRVEDVDDMYRGDDEDVGEYDDNGRIVQSCAQAGCK